MFNITKNTLVIYGPLGHDISITLQITLTEISVSFVTQLLTFLVYFYFRFPFITSSKQISLERGMSLKLFNCWNAEHFDN